MNVKILFKDVAVYGFGNFLFKAIGLFVFPLYTHILSVADFGVMELVNTGVGIVSLLTNLGLNNATQRFYWDVETREDDRPILVSSGLLCMCVWGGVLLLLFGCTVVSWSDYLLEKYGVLEEYLLLAMGGVWVSQIVSYCLDVLRLHFAPWKFTLVSGTCSCLQIVLCLIFLFGFMWGVRGFFLSGLIASFLVVPLAMWVIKKDLTVSLDFQWCKKLVKFGYPFIFAGLAYWALGAVDRWMLATMTDSNQVGLYSVGFKFTVVIFFINSAIGQAWSPYLVTIYAEDPDYKITIRKLALLFIGGLTALAAVMILFANELLWILTPEPYWQAAPAMAMLILGAVCLGSTQFTVIGISLEKKTQWLTAISLSVLGINVFLNYLLIPRYGALGAATAMAGAYFVMTLLYYVITSVIHPIPFDKKGSAFCVVLLIVLCGVEVFWQDQIFSISQMLLKLFFLTIGIAGMYWCGIVDSKMIRKFVLRSK